MIKKSGEKVRCVNPVKLTGWNMDTFTFVIKKINQ